MTYNLSVPVLRHKVFKPSYSCISAVRTYFSTLPEPVRDEELVVIGDRLFTDVVLANRMARLLPAPPTTATEKVEINTGTTDGVQSKTRVGPLSVWTEGVWEKENMFMRALEKGLLAGLKRYVVADNGMQHSAEPERFIKPPPPIPAPKPSVLQRIWKVVRRN